MKRRQAMPVPQFELPGQNVADAFNLAGESTADGARLRREAEERARIAAEAAQREQQLQRQLF